MVDITDTNMTYVFIIFIRVLLITNTKTAFQENNLFRQSVCFRKLLLKKNLLEAQKSVMYQEFLKEEPNRND